MRLLITMLLMTVLSACSMDQMLVRASLPMIEGGITALNQETDLELAEASIPTNLKLLDGMISIDPENPTLHTYASQGYYGLGFGFNEDHNPERASNFYLRGRQFGLNALSINGADNFNGSVDLLEAQLKKLDIDDVPALFWTASNWAKWIDLNRDNPEGVAQLFRPTAMMRRVLELDETYYYGSAHIYFGVFYGGRSRMFGGDFDKARYHFDKAREITGGKLLIADLLQAQYLARQEFDQDDFHRRLTKIINSPDDLFPELALLNGIAKRKAHILLSKESEWFYDYSCYFQH